MAVAGAVLLVLAVLFTVLFPAFPHLRPMLVNMQAALQFLGAALLFGSRMTLAQADDGQRMGSMMVTRGPGREILQKASPTKDGPTLSMRPDS